MDLPNPTQRILELREAAARGDADWEVLCVDALLNDPDARVRAEGMAALSRTQPRRVIPPLVDALGASLRLTRRRAAQALSRLPRRPVLDWLVRELSSIDPDTRRRSAELLGRLGDQAVLPALCRGMGHHDPGTRSRCAAALEAVLRSCRGDVRGELRERVVAAARAGLGDRDPRVRAACARSLGLLEDRASAQRIAALLGGEEVEQGAASEALDLLGPGLAGAGVWTGEAMVPGPEGASVLESGLVEATDPVSAGRLARGLVSIGAPGLERLVGVLERGDVTPNGRVAAARALLSAGELGAWWSNLLNDRDPRVAGIAARALARRGVLPLDDPRAGWLSRGARPWDEEVEARLAPHPRSGLPSASPPFGLPVPGPDHEPRPGPTDGAIAAFSFNIGTNLGVLMRSAEAAGLREMFVVGTRQFHPGAARGTERWLPVTWLATAEELVDVADDRGYALVAVQQSRAAVRYDLAEYPPRPLFVLGAEARGVDRGLLREADLVVFIPMVGQIDSLNVAAAGTVVVFDWLRRHGFPEGW